MSTPRLSLGECTQDLHEQWQEHRNLAAATDALWLENVDEIPALNDHDWTRVAVGFRVNFRRSDRLLLRLHYKRTAILDDRVRNKILRFVTIGYLNSDDVRYFNEFLWFSPRGTPKYFEVNKYHFRNCVGETCRHSFPLAAVDEVCEWINSHTAACIAIGNCQYPMKVATLGPHPLFRKFCRNLGIEFGDVLRFHFPRSTTGLRKLLIGTTPTAKVLQKLFYSGKNFHDVESDPKDPHVLDELQQYEPDLAVHRLGFIIRKNLIAAFRIGILNDHWGALPFVRGRSTPEFSLLFGFPSVSTVHLVDSGVDTGPIVNYYPVNIKRGASIKGIKRRLSRTKENRYVDAVRLIAQTQPNELAERLVLNEHHAGLQYFTMHPILSEYVERVILPSI